MSRTGFFALAIAIMLSSHGCGANSTPREIFQNVTATYKSMQTYKAEGTIISDREWAGTKVSSETSFGILLKKPNLYLISWTQRNTPGGAWSGAVWNDGTQAYVYVGVAKAYYKVSTDERGFDDARMISCHMGSVMVSVPDTIALLFLPGLKEPRDPFSRMEAPKIIKTEKVEEDDCYVISGASTAYGCCKETWWISKLNHLIRKNSCGPPSREQREEYSKRLSARMGGNWIFFEPEWKGSITELHMRISSPELSKKDFQFALPEGAVLRSEMSEKDFRLLRPERELLRPEGEGAIFGPKTK